MIGVRYSILIVDALSSSTLLLDADGGPRTLARRVRKLSTFDNSRKAYPRGDDRDAHWLCLNNGIPR